MLPDFGSEFDQIFLFLCLVNGRDVSKWPIKVTDDWIRTRILWSKK